eukprot:scaffold276888_cov18-Prasinocladus_malaysianus.AAC.1
MISSKLRLHQPATKHGQARVASSCTADFNSLPEHQQRLDHTFAASSSPTFPITKLIGEVSCRDSISALFWCHAT